MNHRAARRLVAILMARGVGDFDAVTATVDSGFSENGGAGSLVAALVDLTYRLLHERHDNPDDLRDYLMAWLDSREAWIERLGA